MKNVYLFFLLTIGFFCSFQTFSQQKTPTKKERKDAKVARGVFEIVKGNKIVATLNQAIPFGEKTKAIDDYPFRLIADTLTCNLPYIGNTSTSTWGGEDISISANRQAVFPSVNYLPEQQCYEYIFRFKATNNEEWECILKVFASARIHIIMKGYRSTMKYQGYLDIETIRQLFVKEQ